MDIKIQQKELYYNQENQLQNRNEIVEKGHKRMKLLYVACRWDPTIQNEYSGSDYGAYHMLKKDPSIDVSLIGPFEDKPNLMEKIINKLYNLFFQKRLIKYFPSTILQSGKEVNKAIKSLQPDVIFSKYSAPMVKTKISKPYVYMCDSTIQWVKVYWPEFSKLGFSIMEKWEEKSINNCDLLITFSHANAKIIQDHYHKEPEKIRVMPIPAYIPPYLIPPKNAVVREVNESLNLLLVGKRFHLRGMDIAMEVTSKLNDKGCPAKLTIVGIDGENSDHVNFVGVFNKEDEEDLRSYYAFFRNADLLIHPSRFHAAGIVISEAAAFGVPTITNDVGGLATSVLHQKTGIVLPEGSKPAEYVDEIIALISDHEKLQSFQLAARERFDAELNWEKAGKILRDVILEIANK